MSAIVRNLFRLVDFLSRKKYTLKKNIDKELGKWQENLPEIDPDQAERLRQSFTRADWQILSTFIKRLSILSPAKAQGFSVQIAGHFLKKMGLDHENVQDRNQVPFLVAIYLKVRDDWEF